MIKGRLKDPRTVGVLLLLLLVVGILIGRRRR